MNRIRSSAALFALFVTPLVASAEAPPPGDLADRSFARRAVETAIWGLPAVNYDLMLQAMLTQTSSKQHEVVYWSEPVTWRNQTLTPNPDAIYFMTFWDLTAGPFVIEVPAAERELSFAGNLCDIWQMPLEDAGLHGADAGKGGKYLILPPGDDRPTPDGYVTLRSLTYGGYALLRSNLKSHAPADVAAARAYGLKLRVYPYAEAAHPAPTKFTDAKDVVFDSTIPYDVRFFRSLDRIVQHEPFLTRDKAMIDPLRTIGIEQGRPFAPDAERTRALDAAAKEVHDLIDTRLDAGFPPFFPGARWASPAWPEHVKAGASGYAEVDSYPIDARAMTYSIGYVGIKRLGTAQFYLLSDKDASGRPLEGGKTYRLRVPPKAPIAQYWSATVYDRATHALVRNMQRASCSSNDRRVKKNKDGSVDVWFGATPPKGRESNWVPTDPAGRFEILFRLYGPDESFFAKTWVLPDVEALP